MPSASKNVYASASSSYPYTMSVSWSESDASVANNASVINASGSFSGANISFDSWQTYYLRLYWHDNNNNTDTLFATSGGFTSAGMSYGTRTVSGSITVGHRSDGSLSGYVKLRFDAPGTSGGYSPGTTDLSTNWSACTTIARASGISGLSGSQLGSSVSVTIDRKASFTHKVEYSFAGSSWATVSSNAETSASFTPPVSLSAQVPNGTSGALTVRVTTYNGSTQIGSSVTRSINLSIPSSVAPSLSSVTANRVDNDVPSGWGLYVKGISQVQISASGASGSYGSTIQSYSISGPGLTTSSSSGTSSTLSSTGMLTYTCTVTDSRGRNASKSVSISVVDYSPPSISVSAERCTSDGTVSANGTYLKVKVDFSYASVSGKNSISSKSCGCNGVSNTSFSSGTAFILSANCSIGSQYPLTASVKDAIGNTASMSVTIPTAYRILNVKKNKKGIAIGKFSEKDAFEVNMDSYFYGDASIGAGPAKMDNSIPVAGDVSQMVKNVKSTSNAKSVLGSAVMDGNWYSLISARHRNGAEDGTSYGMYLRSGLTWHGDLCWGKQTGTNDWQDERRIVDSVNITNMIFPVGAIYLTYNNNNPGNFLGGTWVQFGQGKTLIGQGTGSDGSTSMSFTAGATGGEYKHKIADEEAPVRNLVRQNVGGWTSISWSNSPPNTNLFYSNAGRSSPDPYQTAMSLIEPYISIYFWRRTA